MQNIIFSKDRPLQLDLTINSIKKNWGGSTWVIYKTSTQEFERSYDELIFDHKDVVFHSQGINLFQDVVEILNDNEICFFTDDDVVYNDASRYLTEAALNEALHDTACLSLRLGANISKRDIGGTLLDDNIPELYPCRHSLMKWNRTSVPTGGYWSYPLSVDGHVFKVDVIKAIMSEISSWIRHCERDLTFRYDGTPNLLESIMQRFWFELPPMMAAPRYSCVVNSPNNRVQNSAQNRSGDFFPIDAREALQLFLDKKRINLDALLASDLNIKCPHQELDLLRYTE